MSHALLVTVAEQPRYALGAAFYEQFRPRTLEVQVVTAGALGTMSVQWRKLGETDYQPATVSSPASIEWVFYIDEAFATLTFPAGSYAAEEIYTIAEDETVTQDGSGPTVEAERWDPRETEAQAATDLALGWMKPEVTPPLISWGSDIRTNCAWIVAYNLESKNGTAPGRAAEGDTNVRQKYEDAVAWFKAVGDGSVEPVDLVDSSSSDTSGVPRAVSDDSRGW